MCGRNIIVACKGDAMVYDSPGHDVRLACRARGGDECCAVDCSGAEEPFRPGMTARSSVSGAMIYAMRSSPNAASPSPNRISSNL